MEPSGKPGGALRITASRGDTLSERPPAQAGARVEGLRRFVRKVLNFEPSFEESKVPQKTLASVLRCRVYAPAEGKR